MLGSTLTAVLAADKEQHVHAALIISFCKWCGDDYAGLVPRKILQLAERFSYEIPQSDLLAAERQKALRQLLKDYFSSMISHLKREFNDLNNMIKVNTM